MHTKLHFSALTALVVALSITASSIVQAAGDSTPPQGLFLGHDEVVRLGGVGNYLFRYNPGPHRQLDGDRSLARTEGYKKDSLTTTDVAETERPGDVDTGTLEDDDQSQQAGIANDMDTALDQVNSKLYFDTNSARVTEGREDLGRIGELLANQKTVKIEIDGFADPPGSDNYNRMLSRKRAENVSNALIQQGVPREQIVIKAWGESRQVPDENNRRVEIRRVEG